jgi:hypothetical protein
MELSPFAVYSKAVRAVPSIKYSLAVGGVVAAGMIAYNLSNEDPRRAILAFIFVLAGMYLLLVFASISKVGDIVRGPVIVIVWALTILFVAFLSLSLSAFAFGWPPAIANLLGVVPAEARHASAQVVETDVPAKAVLPAPSKAPNPPESDQGRVSPSAITPPLPAAVTPAQPDVGLVNAQVSVQETFQIRDSSEDCAANQTRTVEYCLSEGARIVDWSGPNITSANCGSSLTNLRRVAGRDNCLAVDVSVRGCGYDNLLGLRNCRGRGWIGGDITINGVRPRE